MVAMTQMCSQGHQSANSNPEGSTAIYEAPKVLTVLQQAQMSTASESQQEKHLTKRRLCGGHWRRRRLVVALRCCERPGCRVAAALLRFSAAALSAATLPAMTCSLCTRHQAHIIGTDSACWQALMGFLDGSECGEVVSDAVKAWHQGNLLQQRLAAGTCC